MIIIAEEDNDMRKIFMLSLSLLLMAGAVDAQKKMKPWIEWTEKDANKILEDSPWARTQTDTDTSEMFYQEQSATGGGSRGRTERGQFNQAINLNYHIRFLSAKPIRAAFAKLITAKDPAMAEPLRAFVDRDFSDYIVVAVTYDASDRRIEGPVMQTFNSANTGVLQNATYLELKNGKRLFVSQYQAPSQDGLGAKFIFPRKVDNQLFILPDSGEVRFYSEVGKNIKLNMRFKVADMMYEGKLEY